MTYVRLVVLFIVAAAAFGFVSSLTSIAAGLMTGVLVR